MRVIDVCRIPLLAVALAAALPNAAAAQDSYWQFRLRGIVVAPNESADITSGGDPVDANVDLDVAVVPEFDISYVFSPNLSAELILATAKHNVEAVNGETVDLGHVWLLPPTVLVQYRLAPEAQVRPYVGAGLNLTLFYSEDPGIADSIEYDSAIGFAVQGGLDIPLGDGNWFLNFDLKKIFLSTDVTIDGGDAIADVTIDPWIFGAGFGLTVQ